MVEKGKEEAATSERKLRAQIEHIGETAMSINAFASSHVCVYVTLCFSELTSKDEMEALLKRSQNSADVTALQVELLNEQSARRADARSAEAQLDELRARIASMEQTMATMTSSDEVSKKGKRPNNGCLIVLTRTDTAGAIEARERTTQSAGRDWQRPKGARVSAHQDRCSIWREGAGGHGGKVGSDGCARQVEEG